MEQWQNGTPREAAEYLAKKLGLNPEQLRVKVDPAPSGVALVKLALLALNSGEYELAQAFWHAHLKEVWDLDIDGLIYSQYKTHLTKIRQPTAKEEEFLADFLPKKQ